MTPSMKQPADTSTPPAREENVPSTRSSGRGGVARVGGYEAQRERLSPVGQGYESQAAALVPVQARGGRAGGDVHGAAAHGTRGSGGTLPHLDAVQSSFGRHDVSGVQAYTGGAAAEASDAMGATAFATGDKVAFKGAPDLHTAAHEAAHVVQQRAGVSLYGGVGAAGDRYEQHADAVADRVVAGESAEGLLDTMVGGGGDAPSGGAVQRKDEPKKDEDGLKFEGGLGHETPRNADGSEKTDEQKKADKAAEDAKDKKKPGGSKGHKSSTGGKMTVDKDKLGGEVTHTRSFTASYTVPLPAFPALRLVFEFSASVGGKFAADTKGAATITTGLKIGGGVGAGLDFEFISGYVKGGVELSCQGVEVTRKEDGSWLVGAMNGDVTGQVNFEGELKVPGLGDIFEGWVSGAKLVYPLTKKGVFVTFSGGGLQTASDDGKPAQVTPWGVKAGPDLLALAAKLGLASQRAKSDMTGALMGVVTNIDFDNVAKAREQVTSFGAELPGRIEELKAMSEQPSSGEYAAEYHDLLGDLNGIEQGLTKLSKTLLGDQKLEGQTEIGHLQAEVARFRSTLYTSPLPTPGERSAKVMEANVAEELRAARQARKEALRLSGDLLQGKGVDAAFTKGSPAWEKMRVANQRFFAGRDAMNGAQYGAALAAYQEASDGYRQVPNLPGRK